MTLNTYTPTDHEDWLEFRRQHLTSTELAGLHLHKQAAHWQQLRQEKQTGKREFQGNAYTTWGTEREPLLAPSVIKIDSRLRYNEEPQTIVINRFDERLCCTPDLYTRDGEVIGEIKTSGKQFEGGKYHEWAPDQYYLQCQLNMEYTGAEACILLVEYRDGTPETGFTPRSIEYRLIEHDPDTVGVMLDTADQWFRWVEHDERPEWMGDLDGLDDADELTALVEQLVDAEKTAKVWAALVKKYKADIEKLVGGSYKGEIAGHVLSVSVLGPTKTFDSAAFKKAHADLYEEYKTKERAGYTRITLKEVS